MRSALPSPSHGRAVHRLLWLLAAVVLGALFLARPAYASGTVSLSSREPVEADGKWKLNMTIDFGSIPQLPHIPMLFSFTPTALYERALLDKTGDKPVLNRIPLQNQQAINESIDVGFSDASGKTFKITKFDFVIRRDHGFEAGEYDLKITRSDDGVQMGQTIKLTLKGDNPIIDRRAITFAGEKPKKKGEGDKADADKKDDEKKDADKPAGDADKKDEGDKTAEGTGDAAGPPPVPPKQGGCGCRLAGEAGPEGGSGALFAVGAIGLGAALWARRRRAA